MHLNFYNFTGYKIYSNYNNEAFVKLLQRLTEMKITG